jgi:prolyl-tRNA synthetase
METVISIADKLRSSGLRAHIDDRDKRAGQKFYDWEIKGVPLRLEIGPRDIENGTAFAARRTGGKQPIKIEDIVDEVTNELKAIETELESRTSSIMNEMVTPLTSLDTKIEEGMIYEIAFDGSDADAEILEKTTGLTVLGECITPFEDEKPCIISGKMTTKRNHIARMY